MTAIYQANDIAPECRERAQRLRDQLNSLLIERNNWDRSVDADLTI